MTREEIVSKGNKIFDIVSISCLAIGTILLTFGCTSVVFIVGLIGTMFSGGNYYK